MISLRIATGVPKQPPMSLNPKTLTLAALLLAALPLPASAHVLESDGPIHAILHVNPSDAPVATQSANLLFNIADDQNSFQFALCECQLTVTSGGRTVLQHTLTTADALNSVNAVVPYSFPKAGVYSIRLEGRPAIPNGFHPFTVNFEQRVEAPPTPPAKSPSLSSWLLYGITALAVVGAAFLIIRDLRSRPR
jgi:hypothetical protein